MRKNRNVWILLTGEFVAGFGLWLGIIGDLEFMQDKVSSDFLKSLILVAGIFAGIIAGPLAGKITDQYNKKTIMLYSGIARLISVAFMFIAIETGSVWWMIAFLVSINLSAAFYFPALQATLPLVVEKEDLLQLNGIHTNVSTLSRILGTVAAGVLLSMMSLWMLYMLVFISYLVLFILTCFLKVNEQKDNVQKMEEKTAPTGQGFKEVFPIIKGQPLVFMTLVLTIVPILFIGGFNLIIIAISEIQNNPSVKAWLYAAEGISFMLGATFVKRYRNKSPYATLLFFSTVIGISQLVLFFTSTPVLTVTAFSLFGFSVGTFFPTAATIFQTNIPSDFHGRFFSFRGMFDDFTYQIVLVATGFLLDIIGFQQMTVIFGVFSLLITGCFYMKFRHGNRENSFYKEAG